MACFRLIFFISNWKEKGHKPSWAKPSWKSFSSSCGSSQLGSDSSLVYWIRHEYKDKKNIYPSFCTVVFVDWLDRSLFTMGWNQFNSEADILIFMHLLSFHEILINMMIMNLNRISNPIKTRRKFVELLFKLLPILDTCLCLITCFLGKWKFFFYFWKSLSSP